MNKLALFSILAIIIFSVAYTANAQEIPMCNGLPATIVGTNGNEVIHGTDGDDVIVGLGGNDVIHGYAGNDILCGGEGYDKIFGYSGDDIIFASVGDGDAIAGGDGIDICNVDPSATFRECEQIIFLVENIEITDEDTSVMITIATDKSSYKPGETIVISGNIDPIISSPE